MKTGAIGTVVAALCCFTPVLVVLFGAVGLSHAVADPLAGWFGETWPLAQRLSLDSSFFWLVLIATVIGVLLSFTPAR